MSGPPLPPPPATLTPLLLDPMTYEMSDGTGGSTTHTYALRARIGVLPAPGEEIAYVSLYRQAVNNAGTAQSSEEFVTDMSWYASHPDPINDTEYYEGFDYSYYAPFPPATKWDYHVKVFVMKYITQKSGNVSYP